MGFSPLSGNYGKNLTIFVMARGLFLLRFDFFPDSPEAISNYVVIV
ncbi:hypothetical protein ACN4EE_01065 [Geminocystis sp. CENA526]